MPTTIEVNKQSVEVLLGSGKAKPFVIPEYQRSYAWTEEQAETLFEDLWEFTITSGGTERDDSYFLGSIVAYENKGEQEIIDGQQRITSLFLLLRAIYTRLIASPKTERTAEANNFIGKIEPAIWRTNKLTGTVDYKNILLTSKVVNNEGNERLRKILETGIADEKATDNYSKNYRHFQKLFDKHATENPLMIYQFIYALLNQAILLPITTDTQDTALTIFSTLNDRGLPLKLNVAIVSSDMPEFNFKEIDTRTIEENIQNPNRNVVRMLLKIIAYEQQEELLPERWEIEHIFPQKWQTNYFDEVPDNIIKEQIEHIGNKLPIEKKLNITAGNGYFEKKKKEYLKSKIIVSKTMGETEAAEWNMESIMKRDVRIADIIMKKLLKWNANYMQFYSDELIEDKPSEEDLARIAEFRKKGWI